ncbi:hypothetical protein GCM10009797_26760 [Nocardioides hwasunensis]
MLTAVACALVVAVLVVTLAGPDKPEPTPRLRAGDAPPAAAVVLARWDERRAAAWAASDPAALEELYVEGSRAGAADVRLLRDYRDRGLAVEGLATQVLALEVVEHTPDRLVLTVTDRVAAGRAVGRDTSLALPRDRASTRRVELVRVDGAWLVAEARDQPGPGAGGQPSAAASTSRTSSSSKS